MAFRDLREYIALLEQNGELQQIDKEVDWNLEIGAIIRRCYDLGAPAPLFRKIMNYPEGYRILGAPLGPSKRCSFHARVALAMGMSPESSASEIIEEYIKRKNVPIKPTLVKDGPCKENIYVREDVDVLKFPAPLLHQGDGGRYIGTWHVVVTRDPDSNWVNWGMYRLMVHDSNTIAVRINPQTHIGFHYYQKYEPRGKVMEFAVALGTEPIASIAACTFMPSGISEIDIAGGLRLQPIEMVRCETVDLTVPATAEIVLEGEVLPHERKDEGPFGEYTGFRGGFRKPIPVGHIKAITHRSDPILTVSCMGVPVDDSHAVMTLTMAAEILDSLRSQGLPIKMVYCPPHAVSHMAVVSTKVLYPNFAKKVANCVWATQPGTNLYYLVVVDDDVDVTNMNEVLHALTTRCHPDRGIFKVPNTVGLSSLPFTSPYEKQHFLAAQVLFDCTWPKDWPEEAIPVKASFDVLWPKEIQDKVLKNWKEYGYEENSL